MYYIFITKFKEKYEREYREMVDVIKANEDSEITSFCEGFASEFKKNGYVCEFSWKKITEVMDLRRDIS